MRGLFGRLTAFALALLLATPCRALEPVRPGQQAFVTRATVADHRLWLLSDGGELSWVTPGARHRTTVTSSQPVRDICARDGHLIAITAPREAPASWTIERWTSQNWTSEAVLPTGGEVLAGMACDATHVMLITNARLVTIAGGRQQGVALSGRIGGARGRITALRADGDRVLVGVAAGEWGGGLYSIDRASGAVAPLEAARDGAKGCQAPLDNRCDPVNAIVPLPWRPGCMAVAVGLIHFAPSGRIVRLCGRDVTMLYRRLLPQDPLARKVEEKFRDTVAFYGLASAGPDLLAVGSDGLYRLSADGKVKMSPLPPFRAVDGIGVAFLGSGDALVLTQVDERSAVGGAVPLLAGP